MATAAGAANATQKCKHGMTHPETTCALCRESMRANGREPVALTRAAPAPAAVTTVAVAAVPVTEAPDTLYADRAYAAAPPASPTARVSTDEKPKAQPGEGARRWWASMSPEERKAMLAKRRQTRIARDRSIALKTRPERPVETLTAEEDTRDETTPPTPPVSSTLAPPASTLAPATVTFRVEVHLDQELRDCLLSLVAAVRSAVARGV